MLNRPHHRLKTRQNASLERIYAGPAQRLLKDTKKELTAEEQRDPTLFKEALSSKYSANIRREGMVLIVPLKHPPPGELSMFEFAIEDSGTIARSGRLLSPTKEPSDFWRSSEEYKEKRMAVARIRALEWSYYQASIYAISGPQISRRPEPTSPAEVSASKPKTEETQREATPEARPPSQPRQVKRKEDTSIEKPISKRTRQVGRAVAEIIPRYESVKKAIKAVKKNRRWNKAELIAAAGLPHDELDIVLSSRSAKSAACEFVAKRDGKINHEAVDNAYRKYMKHLGR